MLKTGELRDKISSCKSFGFCTSVEGLEVLILKGLWEWVPGSADSKGVAGYGVGRAIIHILSYYNTNKKSMDLLVRLEEPVIWGLW